MKLIIMAGKSLTVIALVFMLINLLHPFAGNVSLILNLLLFCTLLMHGIQLAIFHSAFSQHMNIKYKDYFNVFIFGVFSLIEYRARFLNR